MSQHLFGRLFALGAPTSRKQKAAYITALTARKNGNHAAVLDHLDRILARVTDKSNGLLQVASIFAAIAYFLAERAGKDGNTLFAISGLLLLIVASFLLTGNLGVDWGEKEHLSMGTPEYNCAVLDLCTGRIARFTIAMWATVSSMALLGLQVAMSFGLFDLLSDFLFEPGPTS